MNHIAKRTSTTTGRTVLCSKVVQGVTSCTSSTTIGSIGEVKPFEFVQTAYVGLGIDVFILICIRNHAFTLGRMLSLVRILPAVCTATGKESFMKLLGAFARD